MSRRKQAKPRAFLKQDGNVGLEFSEATNEQETSNDEGSEYNDRDVEDDGKIEHTMPVMPNAVETTMTTQWHNDKMDYAPSANKENNVSKTTAEDSCENFDKSKVKAVTEHGEKLPLKINNSENGNNTNDNCSSDVELNNDVDEDDDEVDDDVDDEDDDDFNDMTSLDSFYSGMYSTHTTSSYSPSVSDGTVTPSSLQNYCHLSHYQQQQQQQQQQAFHADDVPSQRTQINGLAKGDADAGMSYEDEKSDANRKMNDNTKISHNGVGNTEKQQGKQQLRLGRQTRHYHGESPANRIPTKMRKIDRESIHKLHKLTGDGIKSSAANTADGSYKCQFCDKSFPRLGYLKKHEQSHAEHLPFKCEYCARLFKHKRSRDRHTKLHTGDRRYRCPHCEAAFSRSDHLKIHMKTHDNQKPFQCTICNRGYNTAAALTSHMQNHKKQAALLAAGCNSQIINYSPRSTGSASSNSSLYKRRYAVATLATDSSPSNLEFPKRTRTQLTCQYCSKFECQTMEQLETHVQKCTDREIKVNVSELKPKDKEVTDNNNLQLSCEYCNMKFAQVQAMFQHMRATHVDRLNSPNAHDYFNRMSASPKCRKEPDHITVKPEQENELQMSEKMAESAEEQPTDLSHPKRQSVTPTPPQQAGVFFCNQCNAGMPDFDSFREHLKSHIAQGLCLACTHCGLNLRGPLEYERHIITHYLSTSAEYKCEGNCQVAAYKKSDELQKHLLDKHMLLLYKCTLCSETFDSKMSIQLHFACTHALETKLYRCSACVESFRSEAEFNAHVKNRHQPNTNGTAINQTSLQCMFCHIVCNSELEMHFHLAAHARQFRCPSCPETFHVEFLLDRHMQNQHADNNDAHKLLASDTKEQHSATLMSGEHSMNSIYMHALLAGKTAAPPVPTVAMAANNNNNNVLDYNVTLAAKLYNPLHVDTNQMLKQHPALVYGFGQHLFDANRSILDMYAQQQQQQQQQQQMQQQQHYVAAQMTKTREFLNSKNVGNNETTLDRSSVKDAGLSCGICERNDFRTETELNSHRKIVHNIKTGVSLRCAYCSGNYKSRNELEHHMKTCHNSTGKHKCLICDEIFPSPAILAEHRLQHSMVGQSGKCSHCSKSLNDVNAFKEHLSEHNNDVGQLPVQCICCRQSLNSEFEIGLHANYHTKSSEAQEIVCALCLEAIPNASNDTKVCESCCRRHINLTKYKNRENMERGVFEGQQGVPQKYTEHRCNLCKMVLPHASKLQEHLIEHTFAGCESRGFICYICSAVFTASGGLLNHMSEHGLNSSPYDCKYCREKFYFRGELDHHLIKHDMEKTEDIKAQTTPPPVGKTNCIDGTHIKQECIETEKSLTAEDDEYIEVEKIADMTAHQQQHQQQQQEATSENEKKNKKIES